MEILAANSRFSLIRLRNSSVSIMLVIAISPGMVRIKKFDYFPDFLYIESAAGEDPYFL